MTKPTVHDQIAALFGVRDVLMMMAREEVNESEPNNYFVFDYLSKSIDIAASALYSTFCAGGQDQLSKLANQPVAHECGFAEPYEYKPPASTTISN